MLPRLPPLVALRAFHALGVTGSVRLAGDALSVSHTVISRHVQNLEAALGVKLVEPAGRGLTLTPEGARFHAAIDAPLYAIANAAAAPHQGPTLTIRCIPGFANARVVPRLVDLQRELPHRDVIFQPMLSRPVLDTVEVDVEIVYRLDGDFAPPLRGELLSRPRLFPVMSGGMLTRLGRPHRPEDFLLLPLVHDHSPELWRRWLRAMGVSGNPVGPCLGTLHLAIEAARLGQGVAMANEQLVARDIETGRLIELCQSDIRPYGYYLVAEAGRWDDPDISTVRNWFRDISQGRSIGAKNAQIADE